MVLEVLEANMSQSKTFIVKSAIRTKTAETDAILNAMDKDALKTLLYVLVPIVQINRKGKCLVGTQVKTLSVKND